MHGDVNVVTEGGCAHSVSIMCVCIIYVSFMCLSVYVSSELSHPVISEFMHGDVDVVAEDSCVLADFTARPPGPCESTFSAFLLFSGQWKWGGPMACRVYE
jgi:hypothetical protein